MTHSVTVYSMHAPRPWAIGVAASRALTSCLRNPDLSYGRRVPARSGRRTPDAGDRDNATPAQPLRSGRATPSPAANRANDFADRQRATTPARALCLAPLEPKRRPLWPERLERERDALPARRGLAAGKEHHLTPACNGEARRSHGLRRINGVCTPEIKTMLGSDKPEREPSDGVAFEPAVAGEGRVEEAALDPISNAAVLADEADHRQ